MTINKKTGGRPKINDGLTKDQRFRKNHPELKSKMNDYDKKNRSHIMINIPKDNKAIVLSLLRDNQTMTDLFLDAFQEKYGIDLRQKGLTKK